MYVWLIEELDRLIGKLHHAGTVTATNRCKPTLAVLNVFFFSLSLSLSFFFEFLSLKVADEGRREGRGRGGAIKKHRTHISIATKL